jgi:hypothetical protein
MGKTRKVRKAPVESATSAPEGTIKDGYVIKKASNGVPRWMPMTSVELNGFRLFTTDIAAKHIGKPITLYTREYKDNWPKKNAWSGSKEDSTHIIFKFVPNGDAIKGKTRIEDWLKSQKPEVKRGDRFAVDGPLYESNKLIYEGGLQLDSAGGKILSIDLLGIEVFVKL